MEETVPTRKTRARRWAPVVTIAIIYNVLGPSRRLGHGHGRYVTFGQADERGMSEMAYRAFVSSTLLDLRAHRAHVIRALRDHGFDVDPMEHWTADAQEPSEFS